MSGVVENLNLLVFNRVSIIILRLVFNCLLIWSMIFRRRLFSISAWWVLERLSFYGNLVCLMFDYVCFSIVIMIRNNNVFRVVLGK